MIVDARSLADGTCVDADVCIVGSGPAGITLALEMLGEGHRICLVESGGEELDAETQELARLADIDSDLRPADDTRRRQLGGNAHLWGARAGAGERGTQHWRRARYLPLDPIDFARRDWVPYSGWPISREDLDPYYERAHRLCEIGPYRYDPAEWATPDAPQLPVDPAKFRTSVEWFGRPEKWSGDACARLAADGDTTLLIYATATVLEERASAETVEHLHVRCLVGKRHTVRAKLFVLAAGGIENPRLLMLSNERREAGLGNHNDLVGRFFQDHLRVEPGPLVPRDPALLDGMGLYDIRSLPGVGIVGTKLNVREEVMERENLLNSATAFAPRLRQSDLEAASALHKRLRGGSPGRARRSFFSDAGAALRLLTSTIVPFAIDQRVFPPDLSHGWSRLRGNRRRFDELRVEVQIEFAPDPENRVLLSDERDAFDRPRPSVRWRWTGIDRRSLRRTEELLAEELARCGVGTLMLPLEDAPPVASMEGTNHHIGTTRMDPDPGRGVVDADSCIHGVPNLYATGSSVFPTSGYANSTLTIIALAIRLADHLKVRLRTRSE